MFTYNYWNERAKKSGKSLKTVMKRSLPDIINRYFDKKQKKIVSSMVGIDNSILEVGCGYGRFLRLLESSNRCVGVDFSKEMLLLHTKSNVNSPLILAQGSKLPFKEGSFDRILCVTVLIHILKFDEIKEVLHEMDYILKDGGIIVIGEMGYMSYIVQKLLLRTGIARHAIALDPNRLKEAIQEMGYSIIETVECGVFPMDVYFIVARK
jgi:ubiquinone/menaquinone biosynthesis C-methylase UbiE